MTYRNDTNAAPTPLPVPATKTTSAPSPEISIPNKFVPRDLKLKPIALS